MILHLNQFSVILQSTRTPTVAETHRSTNKTARTDTIPTPPETPKSSWTNQTPNRPRLPAPTDTVHHYPSSTANQSRSKPTEPVSQRQSRLQNPKRAPENHHRHRRSSGQQPFVSSEPKGPVQDCMASWSLPRLGAQWKGVRNKHKRQTAHFQVGQYPFANNLVYSGYARIPKQHLC